MNPFTNRWLALGIVAIFLLGVSELVGTSGHDGVLSRFASGGPAPEAAPIPVAEAPEGAPAPPVVIEEAEPDYGDEIGEEVDVDPDEMVDEATGDEPEPEFETGTSTISSRPPGPPGVFGGDGSDR